MKRIKNVFVLGILIFTLTGCFNKVDSKIVGTWEYNENGMSAIYVLKDDGTGSYDITVADGNSFQKLTYETKDGKLFIIFEGDKDVFELPYKIRDNSLVITDSLNQEVVYNKK